MRMCSVPVRACDPVQLPLTGAHAALLSMDPVKVKLLLKAGSRKTTKVWRFCPGSIDCVTLNEVEQSTLELFPDVVSRRLGLRMKYRDSFAGYIDVECDGDIQIQIILFTSSKPIMRV